jgi:chaperonin GroES
MKNLKPLGNRVVIKRSAHTMSKGGILLPEASQEKPKTGEVLAVGPGKILDSGQLVPMQVKTGDKVLFSSYAGSAVNVGDRSDDEILVMSEDDILAIVG